MSCLAAGLKHYALSTCGVVYKCCLCNHIWRSYNARSSGPSVSDPCPKCGHKSPACSSLLDDSCVRFPVGAGWQCWSCEWWNFVSLRQAQENGAMIWVMMPFMRMMGRQDEWGAVSCQECGLYYDQGGCVVKQIWGSAIASRGMMRQRFKSGMGEYSDIEFVEDLRPGPKHFSRGFGLY